MSRGARRRGSPQSFGGGVTKLFGALTKHEDLKQVNESQFLYGFVDPDFACRGPLGDNNLPTILQTYKSRCPITFRDFTASAPAGDGPVMLGSSGDTVLIVTPCVINHGNYSTFRPGYSFPTNLPLGTQSPLATPGGSQVPVAVPLNGYFDNVPPGLDMTPSQTIGELPYQYRTVGLRATLTCGSPPLNVSGNCVAGDNGDFYLATEKERFIVQNNNTITPGFDTVNANASQMSSTFGNMAATCSRTNDLGSVLNGKVFEAAWLPMHNRALMYDNWVSTHATDASSPDADDDCGTDLSNNACLMFALYGINSSVRMVLDVTWVIETTVRTNTVIGFLRAEARLASNYLVDWALLQCVPTSGELGSMLQQWYDCPHGRMGYAITQGKVNPPPARAPVNSESGAMPTTSLLQRLLRGDYNKVLKFAAKAGLGAAFPGAGPILSAL